MPRHLVIVGLMGAGKTTVGRLVAQRLHIPMRDSDEDVQARTGVPAARYAAVNGLDALHEREAEVLLDALRVAPPSVVTAAASTIEQARCRQALDDAFVVWLRGEAAVLAERGRRSDHRPLAPDAEAQLQAQAAHRDALFAEVADLVLDVGAPPQDLATSVVSCLPLGVERSHEALVEPRQEKDAFDGG